MKSNKLITIDGNETKLDWYMELLDKSYFDCVNIFREQYGDVKDDYFTHKSYDRFLNDEIKNINKGKYSRALEGLECHHILENEYINISNQDAVKEFKYPYNLQQKENLVYCDVIEHLILHTLIIKETNGDFGEGGNEIFLRPKIEDWFIKGKTPKPDWMKECIKKVSLSSLQVKKILEKCDQVLSEYQENRKIINEIMMIEYHAKSRNMSIEEYHNFLKTEAENEQRQKQEQEIFNQQLFNEKYPFLIQRGIKHRVPRKKILNLLYVCNFSETHSDEKNFNTTMLEVVREDLLIQLNDILSTANNEKNT